MNPRRILSRTVAEHRPNQTLWKGARSERPYFNAEAGLVIAKLSSKRLYEVRHFPEERT